MKRFELGKRHKLCGTVAVDRLFTSPQSSSALCYPLRGVWGAAGSRRNGDAPYKFVVTVPKKRLRHAVDRVAVRRRIREAYRLVHGRVEELRAGGDDGYIDMAFVYVADRVLPSAVIHGAMERLLFRIHDVKGGGTTSKPADTQ